MQRWKPSTMVVTALAITIAPATAYAWNLVCGVSIASREMNAMADIQKPLTGGSQPQIPTPDQQMAMTFSGSLLKEKWDADSKALRGIGLFFLGISELQRIELNQDGSFTAPQSLNSKQTVTKSAMGQFSQSAKEFAAAIQLANKNHLGDEKGLGLLSSMRDLMSTMSDEMNNKKHLPSLDEIQKMVQTISDYNTYGIELSRKHLAMGLAGHGIGGAASIIKQ